MSTETGGEDGIESIQPRRLELSLRPEDGSLLTAPLLHVLLASTDGLYNDFYNMIQGEIEVSVAVHNTNTESSADALQQQDDDLGGTGMLQQITVQTKKERMSKLSFAERRNELGWRLASNAKSIQHVAALCAAAAYGVSTSTSTTMKDNNGVTLSSVPSSLLAHGTAVSSRALQHTRTAWVQADEAQDALYFFHAQLFPSRAAPHDIYGSTDLICSGRWYDLPRDLLLSVDRYHTSDEDMWSKNETSRRWHLAVRGKLLTGEVGWYRRQKLQKQVKQLQTISRQRRYDPSEKQILDFIENASDINMERSDFNDGKVDVDDDFNNPDQPSKWREPLWKVSLKGGIVNLTHGTPKYTSVDGEAENDNSNNNNNYDRTIKKALLGDIKPVYPIDALLTVFPNIEKPELSEWTLLSINVHVQAKTGEFNHQLETSNRQRYDLHRLASLAMSREEALTRRQSMLLNNTTVPTKTSSNIPDDDENVTTMDTQVREEENQQIQLPPAQPLQSLFQVVHIFSLSWQLELLSAQAQALRRGVWSAATDTGVGQNNNINAGGGGGANLVQVIPVRFFNHPTAASTTTTTKTVPTAVNNRSSGKLVDNVLGVVSISFWKVDDSFGSPSMCDLSLDEDLPTSDSSTSNSVVYRNASPNQLQLSIRAEVDVGIRVALSGAGQIMTELKQARTRFVGDNPINNKSNSYKDNYFLYKQLYATVAELLENTSNPFALSASDALLAATKLCSELKCRAVVDALQPNDILIDGTPNRDVLKDHTSKNSSSKFQLPCWIRLSVNRGTISVGAKIRYHGVDRAPTAITHDHELDDDTKFAILFQLVCDARTGSFVCAFPRSMQTLRKLTGQDVYNASEPMAIRILHLPESRRRSAMSGGLGSSNSAQSSHRVVRDAFDGLARSMNLLGQRTGVGGTWDNIDDKSSYLRDRAIQLACSDAESSLIKCCGIAAIYGLSPLAFSAATGVDAIPDM
jgi:hypothetical protein